MQEETGKILIGLFCPCSESLQNIFEYNLLSTNGISNLLCEFLYFEGQGLMEEKSSLKLNSILLICASSKTAGNLPHGSQTIVQEAWKFFAVFDCLSSFTEPSASSLTHIHDSSGQKKKKKDNSDWKKKSDSQCKTRK